MRHNDAASLVVAHLLQTEAALMLRHGHLSTISCSMLYRRVLRIPQTTWVENVLKSFLETHKSIFLGCLITVSKTWISRIKSDWDKWKRIQLLCVCFLRALSPVWICATVRIKATGRKTAFYLTNSHSFTFQLWVKFRSLRVVCVYVGQASDSNQCPPARLWLNSSITVFHVLHRFSLVSHLSSGLCDAAVQPWNWNKAQPIWCIGYFLPRAISV